jgi:3-oxoacyl-[acyl-carrier-protein] synthase II
MIRVLSQRNDEPETASRPFDRERDGFVMGEGAAVLALEERDAAERRGAAILGELLGYGATNDAYHMTAPRPDGSQAARAVHLALDDAALPAEAVDYVNAHGSSTQLNEPAEALAVRGALGDRARRVPVSGTKGLYGHALGASGAIEAAICLLALEHETLPGTCNLRDLDPACDLRVLTETERCRALTILSTSFGFGGMNAALLIGRYEG